MQRPPHRRIAEPKNLKLHVAAKFQIQFSENFQSLGAFKMHSALVRIQNVFGFFTTVASFVAVLIALTALITPQTPTAGVTLRNVQV
jgi:hypothetical protein